MNAFIIKQLPAAILLATSAQHLYAVGMGDMQVESALASPLAASFHVIDADNLSLEEIIIKLGNSQEYTTLNVDRPHSHQDIRFEKIKSENGFIIKLHTNKPIREPYLNFVVSVNWPQGYLFKEYTLLLDPPLIAKTSATATTSAARTFPVTAKNTQTASPSVAVVKETPPATQNNQQQYRTQSGDSLWRIATRFNADKSTSTTKVMNAIFEKNPRAFIKNNPSRLKQHYVLNLPNPSEIAQASQYIASSAPVKKEAVHSPKTTATQTTVVKASTPAPKTTTTDNTILNSKLSVQHAANVALRQRVIELEAQATQLRIQLELMNEKALILSQQNSSNAIPAIAAVAVTPKKINVSPIKPKHIEKDLGLMAMIEKYWYGILGTLFLLLVLSSTWRMINARKQTENNKTQRKKTAALEPEKKPYWEMPAKDLSQLKYDKKQRNSFSQPDVAFLGDTIPNMPAFKP